MNTRLLLHIIAPLIATSLLLLGLGVGAAWYVHRLQQVLSNDLLTNVSGVRAGEELVILIQDIRAHLDRFIISRGEAQYLKAIEDKKDNAKYWLREAKYWSVTPRKKELVAQARRGLSHLLAELALLAEKPWNAALEMSVRNIIDNIVIKEIQKPAQDLLDANELVVQQSMKENEAFADRLAYALLLLGVCGSGAGLLAGFGLARGINRRLVQLSVPIRNAAGRLDEVVGPITFDANAGFDQIESVLHQIAERIGAIIDRLRESERQVLQAEQLALVGQMAGGMAHELCNPLTSMKILVQAAMASEDNASPRLAGRDLIVLEEEITRLEKLVQTFLEFARPPCIDKRTLEIAPLVEQAIALLAERAALVGTRIDFTNPSGQILAAVDPGQFRQVLLNLVMNALEAESAGGVIEIHLDNGPDGWFTIRVADHGCGLPAELGPRIFAPFVTTKETGLGLGLSICKRIAEAHGGNISAANRQGGGAEFTLRLPLIGKAVLPNGAHQMQMPVSP